VSSAALYGEIVGTTAAGDADAEAELVFCELCNATLREAEVAAHLRSIVHNFSQSRAAPQRPQFALQNTRGFRLLRDMCWNGESGLGPREDGPVAPIATTLRVDRRGVGVPAAFKARVTHFHGEELSAHKPRSADEAVQLASKADRARAASLALQHQPTRRQIDAEHARKRERHAQLTRLVSSAHCDEADQLLAGTHPSQTFT